MICSVIGLIFWGGVLKGNYLLHQLFGEQYGLVGMTLSLINLQPKLFCRYSIEEHIGSGFDRS
jgi:hypothetical protein